MKNRKITEHDDIVNTLGMIPPTLNSSGMGPMGQVIPKICPSKISTHT